jgi:hydrogenase large subunit
MSKITIDPITRIEGHLAVEAVVDGGVVKEARTSGTLWRGFEVFLQGKDPRDATLFTQRICGVCPIAHATASVLNLDSAFGIGGKIPDNARVIRNLIFGSNFLQSHILHFYHLAALDYVDVTAAADYDGDDPVLKSVREFAARGELAPFVPRYEGDYRFDKKTNQALVGHYVEALTARRMSHEMASIWGGKMPHQCAMVPGGVTVVPTTDKIASYLWKLNTVRDFIDSVYIPDIIAVAGKYPDYFGIGKGCGNFLSYGVFDLDGKNSDYAAREKLLPAGALPKGGEAAPLDSSKITESVRHSWFETADDLHPSKGRTAPAAGKKEAYSWLKSPRYAGQVFEVGPLARFMVAYAKGDKGVRGAVDPVLSMLKAGPEALVSVLGRHAARALETKLVADSLASWVTLLRPGEPVYVEHELPPEANGMGITEAPRGALGHWITINDGVIGSYQAVVPTTWNASPRDGKEQPGPMEQAIEGTKIKDEKNPYEIVRIVRSFDPCLACAVHVIDAKGNLRSKIVVG